MPTPVTGGTWWTTKKRGRDDDVIDRDREEAIAKRKKHRNRNRREAAQPKIASDLALNETETKMLSSSTSWVKPPCGRPRHRNHHRKEKIIPPKRELFPKKRRLLPCNHRRRHLCEQCGDKINRPATRLNNPKATTPPQKNFSRSIKDGSNHHKQRKRKPTTVVTPEHAPPGGGGEDSSCEREPEPTTRRKHKNKNTSRTNTILNSNSNSKHSRNSNSNSSRVLSFASEAANNNHHPSKSSKLPKLPKPKKPRRERYGVKLGPDTDFARSARCLYETIRLRKKGSKKGTTTAAVIVKRRCLLEHLPVLPNPRRQPRTHGANRMEGTTPIIAKANKKLFDGVRDRDLKIKVLDSSERIQLPLVGEHAKQSTNTNTNTSTNTITLTTGSSEKLRQFSTQQEDTNRKPQQQHCKKSSPETRNTRGPANNEDKDSSKKSAQAENETCFTLTQQTTNNTTYRCVGNTPRSQVQSWLQLQSPSQTPSTSSSAVLSLPMMMKRNHTLFGASSQLFSAEGSSRSQNNDDDEALMIRDAETTERITETTGRENAADDPLRDLGFWQTIVNKEESRNTSKNSAVGGTPIRSFKLTLASLVLAKNFARGSNSNNNTTTRKNDRISNDGFLWLPSILEGGLGHTGLLDDSTSYTDSENDDNYSLLSQPFCG